MIINDNEDLGHIQKRLSRYLENLSINTLVTSFTAFTGQLLVLKRDVNSVLFAGTYYTVDVIK